MMFCYPLGSRVRLASGGPAMLVVDLHPVHGAVTVAMGSEEITLPSVCLDLVRDVGAEERRG